MNFKPLYDRVLIERTKASNKTDGGIIIPDNAKEKPMEGKVVALGKGSRNENGSINPIEVSLGDRVLFSKYSGTEIKIDGKNYMIMKESDLLGIYINN